MSSDEESLSSGRSSYSHVDSSPGAPSDSSGASDLDSSESGIENSDLQMQENISAPKVLSQSLKCPRCTEDLDLEIEVDVTHGYRVQKTDAATQSESPVQQQPLQRTLDHEPTGSYSYTEKDLKVYMYELR
ncbi:hypothetical protein QR680_004812 [Steinernema hermaphroditum]|uniref:Uncharacterized protein n=1 Tax=Steinernema hermaphroditum TaxID=289476 RepID=A0AA39LTT6_9BILA|nr:hypothetical protein QR680_004812 [Steinernema hermaphroditum]